MNIHLIDALIMALETGICVAMFIVAVSRGMRGWAFLFAFIGLACASLMGLEILRGTV